jgi:short-subunit dehydrogenase
VVSAAAEHPARAGVPPRTCIVTGASSGIGHRTAHTLIRAGHTVYGIARRADRMRDLEAAGGRAIPADVTDATDLEHVVSTVLAAEHRIDVLVNNAGLGMHGAVEDSDLDQARRVFEVNLFGPARLTQLVLPHMRARRSGTIINVSSIAGELSAPLAPWYYASKHALEGFSDTLRQEVRRFGIHVAVVQPGIIRTEFEKDLAAELRSVSGHGAYRYVAEKMAARAQTALGPGSKASDPEVVATAIREIVESPAPRPRYAVGYLARPMLLLNRFLPDRVFDRIVAR